ncbi:MAG: fimbria/pilus periplasmic chaperone [Bdellovibrionaceae bacterium]|nr:fimbria/pilus periplasmic chaperone [Pseudobdellovibrionaceae bacterium]
MHIRTLALSFFAIASSILAPRLAHAFAFQPSVTEFTLADSQLSKTFTVDNTNDSKVAVQISAHARIAAEDGQEELPKTDHFSIFPKQLILGPGESKTVRVTYTGPKTISKEAAYRIVAEQLPVDLKSMEPTAGTKLKFLIKYQTSAYVVPPRAKAKLVVESVRSVLSEKKEKQLELVFRNDGDAHRILTGARVHLTSSKAAHKPFPITGEFAKPLDTVNILAGAKRRVLLPWPAGASEAVDAASIELD